MILFTLFQIKRFQGCYVNYFGNYYIPSMAPTGLYFVCLCLFILCLLPKRLRWFAMKDKCKKKKRSQEKFRLRLTIAFEQKTQLQASSQPSEIGEMKIFIILIANWKESYSLLKGKSFPAQALRGMCHTGLYMRIFRSLS